MPRRRERRAYDPHFWTQVQRSLFCARGSHDVPAGKWMRYRKDDYRRLGSCEDCLGAVGITRPVRPERPFTFKKHAPADVRARQVGGDD